MQSHKILMKLSAVVMLVFAAVSWWESVAQTPDSVRAVGPQTFIKTAAVQDTLRGAGLVMADSLSVVDTVMAADSVMLADTAATADSSDVNAPFAADSVHEGMLEMPAFSTAVDSIIEDFSSGRQMIYYYGDASVSYGDMKLTAEYMEYDVERQVVYAAGVADTAGVITGKPEMTQGGKTYSMDNVFYNFKTNKARIRNMTTQEEDGVLRGDNLNMMPDRSINISGGKYTVCDAEHPHFYLRMTKAKVETQPKQKTVFGPAYVVLADVPLYPLMLPISERRRPEVFFSRTEVFILSWEIISTWLLPEASIPKVRGVPTFPHATSCGTSSTELSTSPIPMTRRVRKAALIFSRPRTSA